MTIDNETNEVVTQSEEQNNNQSNAQLPRLAKGPKSKGNLMLFSVTARAEEDVEKNNQPIEIRSDKENN